ncbi:MAG: hypothetical protein WBO55_05515 [Rhizobiaceae bacterium]
MKTISGNALNEPQSPINERELLALHKLPFDAVVRIAQQLSSAQRWRTAAFCYGKSHLHQLGLAFAASCSAAELFSAFGRNARIVEAQAKAVYTAQNSTIGKNRTGTRSLSHGQILVPTSRLA